MFILPEGEVGFGYPFVHENIAHDRNRGIAEPVQQYWEYFI